MELHRSRIVENVKVLKRGYLPVGCTRHQCFKCSGAILEKFRVTRDLRAYGPDERRTLPRKQLGHNPELRLCALKPFAPKWKPTFPDLHARRAPVTKCFPCIGILCWDGPMCRLV